MRPDGNLLATAELGPAKAYTYSDSAFTLIGPLPIGVYEIVDMPAATYVSRQGDAHLLAPAWAQDTAYSEDDEVRNDSGKIYICVTAGTSDDEGTGPSGTGSAIADGTAEWDYVTQQDGPVVAAADCTPYTAGAFDRFCVWESSAGGALDAGKKDRAYFAVKRSSGTGSTTLTLRARAAGVTLP